MGRLDRLGGELTMALAGVISQASRELTRGVAQPIVHLAS
nr:MAG TPA: hypothetical protein [Caudoviricetes sp.]